MRDFFDELPPTCGISHLFLNRLRSSKGGRRKKLQIIAMNHKK
jgi:hypothetical protein